MTAPIAKMFREMIARGVDPEMIALAIETAETVARPVESPVDTAAEKRRAYDRERKRLERVSGGNPVENPVDDDSALTILDNSSQKKPEKKERAKSSRGEKLPPDAKPSAEQYQLGIDSGFDRNWVDQQFEDMRIWARTNEHRAVARKSDWDLTFTGWLRRSAGQAKGHVNGNGTGVNRNPAAAGGQQSGSTAILAGVAAATERRARERSATGQQNGQPPGNGGFASDDDLELFGAERR